LMILRFIIRVLYIFTKGHTMGKRKDWRHVLPGNDIFNVLA
jgi:hypothetical protein